MADPPHNFQTIAAELQVMILTKVFEGAKINVEYPYQIARKIPYHKMQLQGNVKILLVSRSFHSAAKTALFQVATFNHDEFYFGQGRKSRRLQNAAPDAFRQFRHISGNVRFMSEFYNAYKDDRWPYTDLRSVTIGELSWSDRYKFSGSTILDHLKDLKVLQDTVSERNVKLRRPLILDEIFDYRDRTFKKMRKVSTATVTRWLIA